MLMNRLCKKWKLEVTTIPHDFIIHHTNDIKSARESLKYEYRALIAKNGYSAE